LGEVSETIGSPILTGMPMVETTPDRWKYYNSMVMLTQDRSLTRRYDKYHLVPFGEFIPFRSWMPGTFRKFTEGTEDFSRGLGPVPMAWDKGAIGPLICYEVIFPGEVRKLAAAGARWLVNITNDAWFGDAAKPQHLAMTRMRAIENRLPLIRAANTGISAVFDHMGREIGRLEPHWRTALVAPVPAGLNNSHFRQYGAWWSAAWIVLCALLVMAALLLRHRNRRPSVEYVVVPGPPDEPPMCC
jgi:apolipoprotein N-acyltransferase